MAVMLHGRRGVPTVIGDSGFAAPQGTEAMLELERSLALPKVGYLHPVADDGSWYPQRFTDPLEANEPRLGYALDAVDSVVARLTDAGWPAERLTLAGFSQGACVTLEYVARHPRRYAAVAALTGALIGPEDRLTRPRGLADTPLLITTKERDAWVPPERTRASAAILADAGAAVDLRVLPGDEHSITDAEVDALRSLIRNASG